jgi:ribosomal protein S18 acetylase RimI-like enzyme
LAPPTADPAAIEAYLRRAPYLHTYELGDLDPRHAPHTTWIANEPVDAAVLLYRGLATPTIIALAHDHPAALHDLLAASVDALPPRFYAHVTPGIQEALGPRYHLELLGHHLKMGLASPISARAGEAIDEVITETDAGAITGAVTGAVLRLTPRHAAEAVAFYAASYPASYFVPENLAHGPYLAIRDAHGIAAMAGVHVHSPAKRVTSLGNIATRPDARGRGYARRLTAALCRLLQAEADVIGLNVRADNAPAIACYRAVGFDVRHAYDEWLATRR